MLNFALQQFPFRFGLDEGTDPNQQPPGQLVTAENVEWVKGGRLQKREGVESLTVGTVTGANIAAGKRFITRGNELCITDGSSLYAYSTSASQWTQIDAVPDVGLTWKTSADPFDGVAANDAALSSSGYLVQAWTAGDPLQFADQTALWVQVVDVENGEPLITPQRFSTTPHGCRVLIDGSVAYVVWRSGGNLTVRTIDLATMTVQTGQLLRVDMRSTSGWDAMIMSSKLVVAYETSGNALVLRSWSYVLGTNTFTASANGGITSETSNDFRCIAIDGVAAERIYVAYCDRTNGYVRVAAANTSTLAQLIAPVTVDTGTSALNVSVVRVDSSGATLGWSYAQTSPSRGRFTSCKVSTSCVEDLSSIRGTWGSRLISRLFVQGGRVFAFALDFPISGSSTFVGANSCLVEVETSSIGSASSYIPHRYLGKVDALVGGLSLQGFLPSACAVSATETLVPVPFLGTFPQTTSNWRCGIRHVRVLTGASLPSDMWRAVSFGGESYLAGALLHAYDGRIVFDYGIPRAPVVAESSSSSPTAGNVGVGTYLYGFVSEWRSSAGILHRSSTTTSTQAAAGATSTNTLALVGTSFTSKQDLNNGLSSTTSPQAGPIYIVAHRSIAGGSNYFRLTFEPRYNVVTHVLQNATQTLTDTSADSDVSGSGVALSARPLMYTTGGILDDEQPPNLVTMTLHKSRLWGVAGDQRTIWFSKSFQDDLGVAPGFSASFRITMEEDVTAVWSMDEKLIVSSSGRLWYILGADNGPAATGQGSDIQGPFAIQTDVGCTNPRSVVSTPDGTMFENDGAIYLLTRGLELVWIGKPVQDTLASYPNITSAVVVPKKSQVRFTCNNDDATDHRVLVYDYAEKQWSTFHYLVDDDGLGNIVGGAIADAIVHDGVYHLLSTTGIVSRETTAANSRDEGLWIPMTVETAWISAAGPLAFQSVRRFALHGTSRANHALTVSVGVDRSTSYSPAVTWASGSDVTSVGPLEAAELHLGKKCSSIRFKIEDADPGGSGDGAGVALDMMGIEVGVKKGFQKKPATKRG